MRRSQYRVKLGLFLALTFTVVLVVSTRLDYLYTHYDEYSKIKHNRGECSFEDQCLFQKAIKQGLITASGDKLEVSGIDQDFENEEDPRSKTLKRLYYSGPGRVIRGEIERWNESRIIAAIRSRFEKQISKNIDWRIFVQDKSRLYEYRGKSSVPDDFGFVHNGKLQVNFGEWRGALGESNPILFRRKFTAKAGDTLTVQFVGRFRSARLLFSGGRRESIDLRQVTWSCDPDIYDSKEQVCDQSLATAGSIKLPMQSDFQLEVSVNPVVNKNKRIQGYRVYQTNNGFRWHASFPKSSKTQNQFRFVTGQAGLVLNSKEGKVNQCAEDLGLVPMLGVDRTFAYSLNGVFAHSRLPDSNVDIELTIDPILQKHAHQIIQDGLDLNKYAKPEDKPKWVAKLQDKLDLKQSDKRRAALIILNADNGDILATSGWPVLPPLDQLTYWDLKAYHKIYEKHGHVSPLEVQSWQILNRDNTPGSIFKPLVAVAAAKVVDENDSYIKTLIYGMTEAEWNPTIYKWDNKIGRLPPAYRGTPRVQDGKYVPVPSKPRPIANYKSQPLRKQFYGGRLGLREAIQNSSNIFFIKLVMELDGLNAKLYDVKGKAWRRHPVNRSEEEKQELVRNNLKDYPIKLRETMLEFGFTQPIRLFDWDQFKHIKWPSADQLNRILASQASISNITNKDVLYGEPIQWPLAQTAIGQSGIQVTPLHMVKIVSSVINNRMVHPKLIKRIGRDEYAGIKAESLQIHPDVLKIIHEGLKAVPEKGTASGAFKWSKHPDTEITYGKTGTAEVKLKIKKKVLQDTKTVWFVGWRDKKVASEEDRGDKRRLAFACMVTHSTGTGGSVCATMVAEYLRRINQKQQQTPKSCSSILESSI